MVWFLGERAICHEISTADEQEGERDRYFRKEKEELKGHRN